MANVVIDKYKIDLLANAISDKSGEPVTMTLDEMVEAVDGIETGGIIPTGNIDISHAGSTDVTNYATATVPMGAVQYLTTIEVNPQVAVYNSGVVRAVFNNYLDPIKPIAQSGYIDSTAETTPLVRGLTDYQLPTQEATTITPSTSQQTAVTAGKYTTGAVTVSAMPTGTAGTPTATKGAVSNHSVTVTPSVTNTTGYITGSTKTGTAVTVSASELVSGSETKTANGTYDVTNLAELVVNVSGGGGGMTVATANTTLASANASIQFTGLSGEPTSFVVTTASDLATGASPYKTATVVFDGTDLHGQIVTNTSNANASYSTSFTKSYSNGTLTITGSGTNFQANQYKLIYTYGGSSANLGTAETQVGSGATSVAFTGLTDEPDYFSVIFKSNFGTSSGYQRVMSVAYDGTNTYGVVMDSGAKALSSWSYTYSNGTLTVSSQGTNNGGYFHQPGYYQLTYATGEIEIEVEPLTVTTNGVYSETGKAYSPVTVNVSGSSKNAQVVQQNSTRITATTYSKACGDITVSKTGTYDVYWTAYRTSTSGTWGTQLYIGSTAYGDAQETFSSYYQTVHLSNVSLTANQTISVYGRSRGSNYYLYVGQLTIIES